MEQIINTILSDNLLSDEDKAQKITNLIKDTCLGIENRQKNELPVTGHNDLLKSAQKSARDVLMGNIRDDVFLDMKTKGEIPQDITKEGFLYWAMLQLVRNNKNKK